MDQVQCRPQERQHARPEPPCGLGPARKAEGIWVRPDEWPPLLGSSVTGNRTLGSDTRAASSVRRVTKAGRDESFRQPRRQLQSEKAGMGRRVTCQSVIVPSKRRRLQDSHVCEAPPTSASSSPVCEAAIRLQQERRKKKRARRLNAPLCLDVSC
ncbi:hypothetical protein EYF80_037133 [Liparis tanakae]|uniref:Uncharacterized protein n=1 Tax=Liparis tanakae TaxID=230148 RepID=A0A4Z2GIZ3_9TELE|nr:hypothetical protein EYF80_037133 [Liparis tanakae]